MQSRPSTDAVPTFDAGDDREATRILATFRAGEIAAPALRKPAFPLFVLFLQEIISEHIVIAAEILEFQRRGA
jgi:hypothetical protein